MDQFFSSRPLATDEVKYLVASRTSFASALQFGSVNAHNGGRTVRNLFAAEAVYQRSPRPDLSLRPLGDQELRDLNLDQGTVNLLGENNGIDGFNAILFQDYAASDDNTFILAFAGTDDVYDVIEDAMQAFGKAAPQYDAAILIGSDFNRVIDQFEVITELSVTGHSLGGGLASAAAMSGQLWAETFNAAGLHDTTIEKIPGAHRSYDSNIRAYWMDWDMLTFAQDKLNFKVKGIGIDVPSASGIRTELDGPYDEAIDVINVAKVLAFLLGGKKEVAITVGSQIWLMLQSHINTHLQYGMLVNEDLGIDLFGKEFPLATDPIGQE